MLRLADNNILHRRANSGAAPKITFMTQDTYPSSLRNSNQTTPRQKSTDLKSATSKETAKKVRQVSVPIRGSERNDANNAERGKGSLPPLAMRSRIGDESKNFTTGRGTKEGNSGFAEIRRILEQSNRKRNDMNEEEGRGRRILIDDDYDNVGTKVNKAEDNEQVKFLDRWKLEIKRNKILNSMGKKAGQSVDLYRKVKENDANIPIINTDALNRILVESEDDDDDDGGFFEKKAKTAREYGGGKEPGDEGSFKTVENAIQEHNQELINSLVMRKVKKQLSNWDYTKPQTQLKLQIKLIIETVLMKFKALKNLASEHYVQQQVEIVLKKMRIKRTHSEGRDLLAELQGDIDEDKDRTGLDYSVVEAALLRNLENCIDETQKLAVKVTNLNHEKFKVKKEIAQYQDQFLKIDKTYRVMEAEAEAQVNSALERTTRKATSNKQRGAIMDVEAGQITVDFLKMQKLRLEKKKQEAAVNERISELQVMLVPIVRETENVENELKTARDTKAYYKLQLRDLYYKLLKDEKFLVQSKSNASCSWIIRALWRINEEVKDKAFPTFMNHDSIKFMLNFAKEQVNVEKYCRQQNLIGMLTVFEDFKHINALPEVVSPEKAILEQDAISEDLLSSQNGLGLVKTKSAGLLMEEFKERMTQLKKVNLKAKRLVNVVQYNAKGRFIVPKWEDINPFMTNDELLTHISKAAMDHEYSMIGGSPQRQQVDQEKEKEKLKVSKILPEALSDVKTPTQVVREMLDNLENMRKAEINRIIKENVSITLDDRQQSTIKNTFLFLAGKTEGAEAFKKFLKEKKNFDDKSIKSTQTHKKSQSQNSFNPAKNLITVSVMLQQAEKAAEKNIFRSPTNKDLGLATQIAKMNSSSSATLPLVMQDSFEPLTSNASGDLTSRVRVLSSNSKRFFKRMSQITEEDLPQQQQEKA